MAQCHAERKKPAGGFDLYGGVFSGKLYHSSKDNGRVDSPQNWPKYDSATSKKAHNAHALQVSEGTEKKTSSITESKVTFPNGSNGYYNSEDPKGGLKLGQTNGYYKTDVFQKAEVKSSVAIGNVLVSGQKTEGQLKMSGEFASAEKVLVPKLEVVNGMAKAPSTGEAFYKKRNPNIENTPASFLMRGRSLNSLEDAGRPAVVSSTNWKKSGEIHSGRNSVGEIQNAEGIASDKFFICGSKMSGELYDSHHTSSTSNIPSGRSSIGSSSSDGSFCNAEILMTESVKDGRSHSREFSTMSSSSSSNGGSPTPDFSRKSHAVRAKKSGEVRSGRNSSASSSSEKSSSASAGKVPNIGNILGNGGMSSGSMNGNTKSINMLTDTSVNGTAMIFKQPSVSKQAASDGHGYNSNSARSASVYTGDNIGGLGSRRTSQYASGIAKAELYGMGNIFSGNGIEAIPAKRTISRDPEELKSAGNEEYRKGKFIEALSLYDQAISLSPQQPAYRCNRAAALASLGHIAEAIKECEMALELDPSYIRAQCRLGSLYLRLGQIEEAREYFKAARHNDWTEAQQLAVIGKHLSNCIEARRTKNWSSLIMETDATIVAGADHAPQVFALKAAALINLHRLDEADTVLAAAQRVAQIKCKSTSVSKLLLIVQAQLAMARGRFEDAITAAEKAVRLDPQDTEANTLLRSAHAVSRARASGNDLFKAGKYFESCAMYTEGLEVDPGNAILLCNRAASRSKIGQWEKAVEDCNAALTSQPNYTKALLRRAHSYSMLEQWEHAINDYEALRRELPGNVEVAQSLFDAQVALKKLRGEDIDKMHFGGVVEEVFRNDQFRELISAPGLCVMEFNSQGSAKGRQTSRFVEELCQRYPSVNFAKVDMDSYPYLSEGIDSIPSFKVYRNGVKVKEYVSPNEQAIEQVIKQYSN